jgi:crotonobetainyl-CoA:carnitine CoA-transferase CaiB-like acyl-CoA transferase
VIDHPGALTDAPLDEWMDVFAANDVGGDPFLRADEFLVHPQCTANGRSIVVDSATQIGPLAVFEPPPPEVVAPALPSIDASPEVHRPLAGITIVECGYFYATPFASTLLAEAGARVIKVEPNGGDPGRRNWTTDTSGDGQQESGPRPQRPER